MLDDFHITVNIKLRFIHSYLFSKTLICVLWCNKGRVWWEGIGSSMEGCGDWESGWEVLVKGGRLIPVWHYVLGILVVLGTFLYRFLEVHLVEEVVLNGLRGNSVSLTFNCCSEIYDGVVSKCRILHGRYLVTPWLSSPHLQTAFLNFFGRPPRFTYTRQLFTTPDGGTIAFDWLRPSHGNVISKDDITPIVVVIPGLMSDSSSAYIKHLAFKIAKSSWNVVVCNHRGLGGVSLTSEWFYNAGWTEDLRTVVDYLHQEYPIAPLFAVGTSIGANVLVKYLGEDGDNTHLAGAAAICSPWDLLVCDRFISRTLVQRFYSRAITTGLQVYAQTHQSIYSRLADWEGIRKSRFVRDFDNHATCILGKFETADTYYRHSSSAGYVKNVTVPLLCISALDDPVCTREAIPWDECRANKKVVLATTQHGGHLAFFEGFKASGLWWVRAVDEFFSVLHSSQFMHKRKEQTWDFAAEPVMDQVPYVSFTEDGMVSAMVDEETSNYMAGKLPQEEYVHSSKRTGDVVSDSEQGIKRQSEEESHAKSEGDVLQLTQQHVTESEVDVKVVPDSGGACVRKQLKELSRHSRRSMWLLAYIALITTWPVLGSTLMAMWKRKIRNVLLPAA